LFIFLLIFISAGGRYDILGMIFSIGSFIYFFLPYFSHKKSFVKKTNKYGVVGLAIALIMAAIVSSFYNTNSDMSAGINMVLDRIIASADGLEFYMTKQGDKYIASGIDQYFLSVFGVYIKNIIGVQYTNIGQQLSELVVGHSMNYAAGANYTFLLQNVVLGYYWFPIYTTFIASLTALLRNNRTSSVKKLAISYYLFSSCFILAQELEYGFLVFISGFLCYYMFIFPVFLFKNPFRKRE
jgi:hypothetical protein